MAPRIERKTAKVDKEVRQAELEEMLETVTKRHRLLKKKLRKTKNNRVKDRITIEYMLKQSIEMLELSNSTFVSSGGKGLYAVVALNNNIRELQNDLRSLEDNSEQIEYIIEQVINPMLTIISQQNLNFVMLVKEIIQKRMKADKAAIAIDKINDMLKSQANLYDDCKDRAVEQLEKFLNG